MGLLSIFKIEGPDLLTSGDSKVPWRNFSSISNLCLSNWSFSCRKLLISCRMSCWSCVLLWQSCPLLWVNSFSRYSRRLETRRMSSFRAWGREREKKKILRDIQCPIVRNWESAYLPDFSNYNGKLNVYWRQIRKAELENVNRSQEDTAALKRCSAYTPQCSEISFGSQVQSIAQ